MKTFIKSIVTATFLLTTSHSVFSADTGLGSVTFTGKILSAACKISIEGQTGNEVKLGEWPTSTFKAVGDKTIPQPFKLLVSDCLPGTFNFNFTGAADTNDANLLQVSGGADGVGIAIANANALTDTVKINTASGTESNAALKIDGTKGELQLQAYYQSTLETVTPGEANATVRVTLQQK
jgi:type 1 fimbria pilin